MKDTTKLTRRQVLGASVATGLAARAFGQTYQPSGPSLRTNKDETPRHIIFMVADGMSLGVPSLVESFSRLVRNTGTSWNRLQTAPETVHGFFEMHSLNSLVTDSSAASSSWGSGSRVFNGAINMLPNGTRLTPIAQLARGAGRRIGLVTTTTITHATPAGFATVQGRRNVEDEVAPQYLDLVDVLMGGGREFFDPKLRKDKDDLIGKFTAKGYALWDRREPVVATERPQKVLGLFGRGHLPFTLDHQNQPELKAGIPSLAEMAAAALDILGRSPGGFLLQIEGGRVDHAAHANDAAAMFWDQLAFDDAIGVVLAFVERHPDTLVVITSDHGNSNPGLNGMGKSYSDSTPCFEQLAKASASFSEIRNRLKDGMKQSATSQTDTVIDVVRSATGITLSRAEGDVLSAAIGGKLPADLNRLHVNLAGALGQALGNYNGIGWTGVNHTADWVVSMALGPGKTKFAGLLKNTDAFRQMTALMGISHTNPQMSPADAKKYLALAPCEETPHWA